MRSPTTCTVTATVHPSPRPKPPKASTWAFLSLPASKGHPAHCQSSPYPSQQLDRVVQLAIAGKET